MYTRQILKGNDNLGINHLSKCITPGLMRPRVPKLSNLSEKYIKNLKWNAFMAIYIFLAFEVGDSDTIWTKHETIVLR